MSRGRFIRVHSFGGADLKNCLEGDLVFILVVEPISGKIPRGRFRVHSRGGGSTAPVRRGKKAVEVLVLTRCPCIGMDLLSVLDDFFC